MSAELSGESPRFKWTSKLKAAAHIQILITQEPDITQEATLSSIVEVASRPTNSFVVGVYLEDRDRA